MGNGWWLLVVVCEADAEAGKGGCSLHGLHARHGEDTSGSKLTGDEELDNGRILRKHSSDFTLGL